jgi:hypothetical protein
MPPSRYSGLVHASGYAVEIGSACTIAASLPAEAGQVVHA